MPLRQPPSGEDETSLLAGVQSYEDLKDTSLRVPVTNTAMEYMISAQAYNLSETPQARRIGISRKEDPFCD